MEHLLQVTTHISRYLQAQAASHAVKAKKKMEQRSTRSFDQTDYTIHTGLADRRNQYVPYPFQRLEFHRF